ncbi:MAG: phosphocholine cytidylyltransferase family protein [Polyangiaceae bacterium]|nr:phosphocholine cytidylyltransferase family protein [Polyangiaceae bacterium]
MKAIIIGAGRGSRLEHLTEDVPKTLVPVLGRPMLDQILDALAFAGFARKDVVFITGYRAEVIRERYPDLTFVHNAEWESNNILLSLLYAREHMKDGFVSTYADIVYRPEVARDVRQSAHPIALGCDVDWRRRYVRRTRHPETDAEKLLAEGERVTRLSRTLASEEASGEFIGVMKVDAEAVPGFLASFDVAAETYRGKTFREGRSFEKAYLIDFLQHLLETEGAPMFRVDTPGGYMEIDTLEDRELADAWWRGES